MKGALVATIFFFTGIPDPELLFDVARVWLRTRIERGA